MSDRECVSGGGDREADFDTRDIYLVAALLTMDVRPVDAEPVRIITREHRAGENYQFYLEARSRDGKYRTRDLLKFWIEGESWVERNPDHPFAYAMAMALNLRGIHKFVKEKAPHVFLQRGKGVALLPLDASAGLEEKILGRLPRR